MLMTQLDYLNYLCSNYPPRHRHDDNNYNFQNQKMTEFAKEY